MPIRVLLLARELGLGGSERQMTEIARGLDRSSFEPHVGCFVPEGLRVGELRDAHVPIFHIPVNSFKSPAAVIGARRLARYVREHSIQIVHAFDYPMNVFAIPVARYFTKAVCISSQRGHRDLTPSLYLRLLRQTDGMADGIVVNCEFLKRHLIADYGILPECIHLCYNGIDLDIFQRDPLQLEREELSIGTLSALRPEKSIGTLLEAFALIGAHERVRLVIVGSGSERENLERSAGELGIQGRVTFQPATREVAQWLRAMDIFVLGSRTEALSNALMEAMACGCACVASNVGGNPELIRHEKTGLLFEPGDSGALAAALRALLENDVLRRRIADTGHAFIHDNFSLAASAQRMGEIYEELLSSRRGRN